MATRFWIIVASRDHIQAGVEGGFAQACHGKASPLNRMKAGDGVIYYSSKEHFGQSDKCQRFTAIGRVNDNPTCTHDMGNGFVPARRNITYMQCNEAPIQPLIDALSFIPDKKHWGAPFRFGFLEVPEADFCLIAGNMLPNGSA
jgi:hypothetical protein